LLVVVEVSRHPIFQRQDYDIFSTAPVSYATAVLGGDIRISTVDGDIIYNVKPGTQTDTKVRLREKGVPSLRNKNVRGDHYVTLVVQVPTNLNAEQKDLLRKFDDAMTGNNSSDNNDSEKEKGRKKFWK
ncbi:MAG TPA: molecular chaperone DnaJ, partial [Lachnospiraceae bacterium]|nr:molecular chaperone DnaJ [Lachnospiraceae bacterium]